MSPPTIPPAIVCAGTLENTMKLKLLSMTMLFACSALQAQTVDIKDAWIRSTAPGQQGTGAFMNITAKDAARLVGVSSPVAGVVAVHEMKMQGDVMTMRVLPSLDLPAGQTVQLKPGGYHVMMMDLKQALPTGSTVPLVLRFKNAKGVESQVELKVPVSTAAPVAAAGMAHDMATQHGEHKH